MATAAADAPARVGLFGGTFDPPHLGHVTVARDVADHLGLDEVWWMVAARSPFKSDAETTPGTLRLEMVRAACATDPRFVARDDELRRGGVSYTVDTLRRLGETHPETAFFLLVGADQAAEFDRWKEPEAILDLATMAVMDRDGILGDRALPPVPDAAGAVRVPVTRVDVSSTAVREAVARGDGVSGLVDDGVRAMIERHALYR